ncbi:hypothetical protein PH7735_00144 [Shimia thalassica]|uniref:Uncharacterized protein n=1 Tax=Shimia thalassica TaxID=1715693 RepID=A0A0P1I034_9RHOB|nr:hypothetical protein PH7735_00144 [Shimia thalassica]
MNTTSEGYKQVHGIGVSIQKITKHVLAYTEV